MEYRRLGRTELRVSAVGFGTAQLRLVPERQAIDTLLTGFSLGVNIVHTAPDYGNAEDLVARALRETDAKVIVASQGYDVPGNIAGPVTHFERLFEATCERLGTERLDVYGIACIDDREHHGENVWGRRGMVEFLLDMKARGRLGGIFCTAHGSPEYVTRLIASGAFDAVMIAYNILGYHLLSYPPPPGRPVESLPRNREEIFPLCREHDIGLMIMKPLAGGLLCPSKAFPPRNDGHAAPGAPTARDVLRSILEQPEVACVLPGTASVDEAEQNARSGHAPIALAGSGHAKLATLVTGLRTTVCSRCGKCDDLCSQKLPVSSIFWAGLFHLHPSGVLEQPENIQYFHQHPSLESVCATCPDVTCVCPAGIDIPRSLVAMHAQMVGLMQARVIPAPDSHKGPILGDAAFGARIVSVEIPKVMDAERSHRCRLHLENAGARGWLPDHPEHRARVALGVFVDGARTRMIEVTQDVHRGGRWHVVFEVAPPPGAVRFLLRLRLLGEHQAFSERLGPLLVSEDIAVHGAPGVGAPVPATARTTVDRARSLGRTLGRLAVTGRRTARTALAAAPAPVADPLRKALRRLATGAPRRADIVPGSSTSAPASGGDPPAYGVAWLEHNLPASFRAGEPYQVYLRARNTGSQTWRASDPAGHWVEVALYVGAALQRTARIPRDVPPGDEVFLTIPLALPAEAEDGAWTVTLSLLEQNVAWFHERGAATLVARVCADAPERGALAEACAVARASNPSIWQPAEGITRSRSGRRYPTLIEHAAGCRVRDPEGTEWIDYVMAGGAALLGYAHPEIQAAVARQLASGAVATLGYTLEATVTRMLCEAIPCAEMALFGKHGSDACTVAIRTARLHTGRRTVLYSGYHGWHDWYAQTLQPQLGDTAAPAALFRFELGDTVGFRALADAHRGRIAAVILEPAAQAGSLDAPPTAADHAFLRVVADVCREQGAVLIFDEIVTGFRYAHGSVQRATGVIPDLTCLGKALSGGLPLSALVGRRDVMRASQHAAYMPTFRGEAYSLAAAVAALEIHRREDVPRAIQDTGTALMGAVNAVSRDLGVPGAMIGVPFRTIYRFDEPDAHRRVLMRTLLQQELLQRGVLTYKGFMLPSLAHGPREIEETAAAFRGALTRVRDVAAQDAFVRHLEIPLL